jgi:hypothetical protein
VKDQRKQEFVGQVDEMKKQVSAAVVFFDRETQLWTSLEEDDKVQ